MKEDDLEKTKEGQESNNKKKKQSGKEPTLKNFVLIIVFAVILAILTQGGISLVIQKFLNIPAENMGFASWGDTFFLRILASLSGTLISTFVIGTFLASKARIAAFIAVSPTILFWVFAFISSFFYFPVGDLPFEGIKQVFLIPLLLIILSPVAAHYGVMLGSDYRSDFNRPKSILNIRWYHWLWILPFSVTRIIAVSLFFLVFLVQFDFEYGGRGMHFGILQIITNSGYFLGRIIILIILYGLFGAVSHAYSLLTEETEERESTWKKGLIIFGYVLLFFALHFLIFGEYIFYNI